MQQITCDNCGACCMEQGSPPGYLYLLSCPELDREHWPKHEEDVARLAALPPEALAALQDYRQRMLREQFRGDDGPCCWLNTALNRCCWYEWRPSICRDFDPGSRYCRGWRNEYNIDVDSLTGKGG